MASDVISRAIVAETVFTLNHLLISKLNNDKHFHKKHKILYKI